MFFHVVDDDGLQWDLARFELQPHLLRGGQPERGFNPLQLTATANR
jgi:hypothetical protein